MNPKSTEYNKCAFYKPLTGTKSKKLIYPSCLNIVSSFDIVKKE